jgi:hypothetical protein
LPGASGCWREFHQRGHVGKAHVIGAGGHAVDRIAGAVAGVDGDIQFFLREVALGLGHQEQGGRPFEAPVQLELDLGFLCQRQRGLAASTRPRTVVPSLKSLLECTMDFLPCSFECQIPGLQ